MFSPGNFGIWQLLLVLLIVVLLFGTKRLRSIGTDLGGALKSFRKGLAEDEDAAPQIKAETDAADAVKPGKSEAEHEAKPR